MNEKTISILVVDDDRTIRDELEKELKRNFFRTLLAPDGKTAGKILSVEKVDILVLDVNLPDISGLDLLKRVKEENPKCEVIVITGYGTHDIAVTALKLGAIDYIEKPFNNSDLSAALGRAQENLAKNMELGEYQNSILVLDDEVQTAERLQKVFEKEGFKTFVAFNGMDALKVIEENKIDVLISDIHMKGMDGNEVLRKAKERYQDIEGIMVTGFKDQVIAINSLRAGAFGYITKPINIEELLLSVNKALERIKLNRSRLFRDRELKITSEIIARMNEDLEKKIEERTKELDQTQAQLFQTSKLATLGEMAAGMAHEINQPLTGIMLILDGLRKLKDRGKLTDVEFDEKILNIKNLSRRIDKTIKHMRTFARQEELKFIEMNINDSIESVLELLLGQQLKIHNIEIIKNLSEDLPSIEGEPHQIEQVIANLVNNARDAVDKKEKDLEEGKPQGEGFKKIIKISTAWNRDNQTVEIVVNDNGVGIPPKILEKIFVPFVTTKDSDSGCGLGMSISYGIIKSHNGTIDIKSKEGEGTTVRLIFPIKKN